MSPAGAPGTGPRRGRRTGPVRGQDGPPHDGATPAEPDVPADALSAGLLAGGLLDGPLGATDRAHDAPDTDAPKSPGTDPVAAGARPAAPGRRAAGPRDDARIDDLAHRAAAGERNALHELLRLVDPLVFRYCRAHLGSNRIGLAGPEDVAQEVMVAVCKALPGFDRSRSVFMAFVYGIAGNKIADAFRAAARDRSVSTDELPEGVDLAGGPEAEALRDDAARRVGALLARLPGSARTILVHRLALNYSAEETAALVGMTPGAVRVAQHRALQKLREWITRGDF
ncbi:RNA polymerase sigma factor ShbA [Pseudonocardia sp. N23]|uniref:RNA polymerase sigma factor ShbA n=1 Tax=Pseudonocardia sp. N23 TaxID=1987376 RepID=UPI000C028B84|nr:RNA polymerase sigma factor ShbA [Pseudonocardia sp. N23]GAY13114.1 RNA polymerase sigma-70 factor [Pseudonocardia sp. N23]